MSNETRKAFGLPSDNESKGYCASFTKGSGNYLQKELDKNRAAIPYARAPYGKRFCETCQLFKPKGNRKAVKGWRCDDCRAERKKEAAS